MRKKGARSARLLAPRVVSAIYSLQVLQASRADAGQGENLEEIVVTGLIGSLQRNLDLKREAAGVVDVITSEDIGKFPDSNVAASLQRVPGVSIQRSGTRGEPEGITVRGFGGDFNETLYDGRRISTAAGGRSVDFTTVGADFVGSLTVMKTPDVTLSSSSIGATVNVAFPKPFDSARHAIRRERRRFRAGRGGFDSTDRRAPVQQHVRRRHDGHSRRRDLHEAGYRHESRVRFRLGRRHVRALPTHDHLQYRRSRRAKTRPSSAGGSSSSAPSSRRSRMNASMAASRSSGVRRTTRCSRSTTTSRARRSKPTPTVSACGSASMTCAACSSTTMAR